MVRAGWLVIAAVLLAWTNSATADAKYKLRIATAAPDGTSWAKAFHKMEHDVDKETNGEIAFKFYFGGIAGSEQEVYDLLQAGKLDGVVSGGPLCRKIAPSMRVLDVVGLFQNQEEATYVLTELRPTLDKEAHDAGYAVVGTGSLGPLIMFSREPITTMAELEKARLWSWDLNRVFVKEAADLKIPIVTTSLIDAQKAFDNKQSDGFVTTPVAALAFQWYVGTKYITDLRMGYLMGCFIMREGALDKLPPAYQTSVRRGATKLGVKIDADNQRMDQKLLGGMYEHLGLKFAPVSKKFRAEFFDAARIARQHIGDDLVSREVFDKVTQLLADYRAEHE